MKVSFCNGKDFSFVLVKMNGCEEGPWSSWYLAD